MRKDDRVKQMYIAFAILFCTSSLTPTQAKMDQDEIFTFLQEAFQAQLSLTDEFRSMEEIEEILEPYFTSSYMDAFLEEQLYASEEGYTILGSDVYTYFIPFFTYDQTTKVKEGNNQVLIYEFFPGTYDGPVVWEDHYEGILLVKTNQGWKIDELQYSRQAPLLEGEFWQDAS